MHAKVTSRDGSTCKKKKKQTNKQHFIFLILLYCIIKVNNSRKLKWARLTTVMGGHRKYV